MLPGQDHERGGHRDAEERDNAGEEAGIDRKLSAAHEAGGQAALPREGDQGESDQEQGDSARAGEQNAQDRRGQDAEPADDVLQNDPEIAGDKLAQVQPRTFRLRAGGQWWRGGLGLGLGHIARFEAP